MSQPKLSQAVGFGRLALLVGGFVLLGFPSRVASQPSTGEDLTVKQAYRRGMTHYKKGEHAKAVEYFRYALERQDHPVLRFNLSQSYSKLGEWKKAVEQGVKVAETGELGEETATKNQATIVAGRVVLSGRVLSRRSDRLADREHAGNGESRSSLKETSQDGEQSGIPDPHELAARQEAQKQSPLSGLGWGGIGAAGVGVGLLAGALAVDRGLTGDFEARSKARQQGDGPRARQLASTIRSKQKTGRWLMYGGIGVATVGAGLLAVDLAGTTEKPPGRTGVTLAPIGGGLGVVTSLDW